MKNDIYGPYIPDQGQVWDNDNKAGNNFGTGDADIALEGNTLYLFTERPIGVAYRELNEIIENTGQYGAIRIEYDSNGDEKINIDTGWITLENGQNKIQLKECYSLRIHFRLMSEDPKTSPLIRKLNIF